MIEEIYDNIKATNSMEEFSKKLIQLLKMTNWRKVQNMIKRNLKYGVIMLSLFLFFLDSAYKLINNINYYNKTNCFLYKNTSKITFLIYENFIELWIIMIFGIFCAVLLKRYFVRYNRFYPKGPISAFLYSAVLPLCACSTIPFISTLKGKLNYKTIITFIVAEPLLSPVVIFLSFSVLGSKYGMLRIICSFILAVGAGYFLEFMNRSKEEIITDVEFKCDRKCENSSGGIFEETWSMTRQLIPYILIAGILGAVISYFQIDMVYSLKGILDSWYGKILSVLIGIPIYVCNGGDIFLLRALLGDSGTMPYGAAIAFSLSASVICIPSIVLLSKVLGKRNTTMLILYIFTVCLIFGFVL